jgi:hypothetical protein
MSIRQAVGPGFATLLAALVFAGDIAAQTDATSVTVDRGQISTGLGDDFGFRTTIANPAATPTVALIAHLNILSLRDGVYVDPEDWSSQRTWYLGTIPAGESRTIKWNLKAVNGGNFAAYVAVLQQNSPVQAPTTSPTVEIDIAERRTLNAGGILPLALGIPALVGLLAGGVRLARRSR